MKKLQFILAALFILLGTSNAFSQTMTFVITEAEGESSDFNKQIALYTDVDLQKGSDIKTLIKPNGDVIKNFDTTKYYEGVTSQEEVDERTNIIAGSNIAIVSIDIETNQLGLTIGEVINNPQEILKSTSMSLCDLDSSKAAIFDMDKKLAIYCVKN